jgi:alpha-glucuronidase
MTRLVVALALGALTLRAESGYDAWLRYAELDSPTKDRFREVMPAVVATVGGSPLFASARRELIRGTRGMLGRTLRVESGIPKEPAIILARLGDLQSLRPQWNLDFTLQADGYALKTIDGFTIVTGSNDRGVLYGVFALLRMIALGEPIAKLDQEHEPYAPVRWVNHWDNLDGSIERGYGGASIFWANRLARADLSWVRDYARMLASLGINGCSVNNVNADTQILSSEVVAQLAHIADVFRPWGVQVVVAVDLGSPKTAGGLDTFDPLDPRVAAWWKSRIDELYRAIPDLGGIIMKADSEGRVGPSEYKRTHANAANVVARALKPHGGLIFYRGFVYDHHADWRNLKNDRARAAYDNFKPLDGKFDDNVVIQIKNGPIDFQVREPPSPLFAALERTSQAIELEITQEYFGQARHTVFLVPMWKDVLDFDLHANGGSTPVKALAAGKTFHRSMGGFVGVSNVGLDDNWTGNHLSQANLYGFGRLAWNPDLSASRISEEWAKLTFGATPQVVATVNEIQLTSWRSYENYTGPFGLQTLTDITGNHYGVSVEASERNGWGQWHRADETGVGMDRTGAMGTGFIDQYPPQTALMFESLDTCPDDLLLFMHHVPYTYRLHSGKTVIQSIYEAHYDGAESVSDYVRKWKPLRGRIDERRFDEILSQLEYQAGQADVWRDGVNNWFFRTSSIADERKRVGHHPNRVEAESMALEGYRVTEISPWEAASGGKIISCAATRCRATLAFRGTPGWYTIRIRYFDQNNGASHFQLSIGHQVIDDWTAGLQLPTTKLDGTSSTRRSISGVALRPGDEVRIEATPDGDEEAALDYIELIPER